MSFAPSLRVLLAVSILGGGLLLSAGDAEARFGSKKAGWSRSASSSSDNSPRRAKLFSKLGSSKKSTPVAAAAPRPARQAVVSAPAPKPKPRPARVSVPVSREVTSAAPTKKRGLLAKLFGGGDRTQAAARVSSPTGLTRVEPKPAAPKLAPGQPNANQSAPVINRSLLAKSSKSQSSVVVNIARQRAYVYVGGSVAIDTPISTARSGKYTPRGTFYVGERVHTGKISTIYKVEMPRWMRLGGSAYGMHAGYLPGYPASAGCIRMPYSAADAVYNATKHGTRVKIISG